MYREPAQDRALLVVAFRSMVFALDRITGELRWWVRVDTSNESIVELAIDGSTVIACSDRALAFIDYETGQVRKRVERKDDMKFSRPIIVIDGDQLFLANSGYAACYSLQGDLLWQNLFEGQGSGPAALGFPNRVRQADDA